MDRGAEGATQAVAGQRIERDLHRRAVEFKDLPLIERLGLARPQIALEPERCPEAASSARSMGTANRHVADRAPEHCRSGAPSAADQAMRRRAAASRLPGPAVAFWTRGPATPGQQPPEARRTAASALSRLCREMAEEPPEARSGRRIDICHASG
jgi:hypothetical protein